MVEITEVSEAELRQLEDDIDDETIGERLWGLTEMFPDSLRSTTSKAASLSVSGVKNLYKFSRSTLWVVGTSFVILAMPVLFEVERVQSEEAVLMQQRQILLGPGSNAGPGGQPLNLQPRR